MTDIEKTIAESLRARADRQIRTDLRAGALARARRIGRRRRASLAGAGVGLTAVLTLAVIGGAQVLSGRGGSDPGFGPIVVAPPTPSPTANPGPTTLPGAYDVVPAGQSPAGVGTDPGLLHFDVDLAALDLSSADWTSDAGYESMTNEYTATAGKARIWVFLGTDPQRLRQVRPSARAGDREGNRVDPDTVPAQPVTVNGRPGTLRRVGTGGSPGRATDAAKQPNGFVSLDTFWVLEWQPVDGLYAVVEVSGDDRDLTRRVAAALRLDRAQRCVMPVRFTDIPTGWTWRTCSTAVRANAVNGSAWVHSTATLRQDDGDLIQVYLEEQSNRAQHDLDQFRPTITVNGYRAAWLADPRGLWILHVGPMEVFVGGATETDAQRITQDEAVGLFAGMIRADDLAQPASWPERAVP